MLISHERADWKSWCPSGQALFLYLSIPNDSSRIHASGPSELEEKGWESEKEREKRDDKKWLKHNSLKYNDVQTLINFYAWTQTPFYTSLSLCIQSILRMLVWSWRAILWNGLKKNQVIFFTSKSNGPCIVTICCISLISEKYCRSNHNQLFSNYHLHDLFIFFFSLSHRLYLNIIQPNKNLSSINSSKSPRRRVRRRKQPRPGERPWSFHAEWTGWDYYNPLGLNGYQSKFRAMNCMNFISCIHVCVYIYLSVCFWQVQNHIQWSWRRIFNGKVKHALDWVHKG